MGSIVGCLFFLGGGALNHPLPPSSSATGYFTVGTLIIRIGFWGLLIVIFEYNIPRNLILISKAPAL